LLTGVNISFMKRKTLRRNNWPRQELKLSY
jgi:hypothetical protein